MSGLNLAFATTLCLLGLGLYGGQRHCLSMARRFMRIGATVFAVSLAAYLWLDLPRDSNALAFLLIVCAVGFTMGMVGLSVWSNYRQAIYKGGSSHRAAESCTMIQNILLSMALSAFSSVGGQILRT